MKIELIENKKTIGYVTILSDNQGGGLNGGIFFSPIDNQNVLSKDIPLFENFKITN